MQQVIPNTGALNPRIQKEIREGYKSKEFDFFYDDVGKYGEPNAAYMRFTMQNGFYANQIHVLRVKFEYGSNERYIFPKNPPNIIFVTPIFHTNISTGGSICLDVIKPEKWSPMYTLETIFYSIIALMGDPNTSSPFNSEASQLYNQHIKDPGAYKKICQDYYMKKIRPPELTAEQKNDPAAVVQHAESCMTYKKFLYAEEYSSAAKNRKDAQDAKDAKDAKTKEPNTEALAKSLEKMSLTSGKK